MKAPLIQSQIVMILLFHHFMLDEFKLYNLNFVTFLPYLFSYEYDPVYWTPIVLVY